MRQETLTSSEKGEVLARLRAEKPELTMHELAQMTGISEGHVSKLLKRQRESEQQQQDSNANK